MTDNQLKMLFGAAVFAAWGGLVVMGKADPGQFVNFLQSAIVGLGVFHAALTNPKE